LRVTFNERFVDLLEAVANDSNEDEPKSFITWDSLTRILQERENQPIVELRLEDDGIEIIFKGNEDE
jgi:hypothetical protein